MHTARSSSGGRRFTTCCCGLGSPHRARGPETMSDCAHLRMDSAAELSPTLEQQILFTGQYLVAQVKLESVELPQLRFNLSSKLLACRRFWVGAARGGVPAAAQRVYCP